MARAYHRDSGCVSRYEPDVLASLVLHWGYLAVGVGTFLEGETFLLAGGALAHRHLLSLPLVIVVALVGSFAGNEMWFLLGRRYGRPFIERRPSWQARAERVDGWIGRWGNLFVLVFRFLYGLRTIVPVALGASRYSAARFAVLNALGGAIWAPAIALAGYGIGAGVRQILARHGHVYELILAAILAMVVIWMIRRRIQRRELAAELASRSPDPS